MKCDKVFNDINFTCFQGRVAVDLVVPMTVPTVESPSILSLASTCTCWPTQVKSLMNVGFVANDSVGKETWGRIWLPPMLDFHWIRNDWMKYWSKGFSRKRNMMSHIFTHVGISSDSWRLEEYWSVSCGIESSYTYEQTIQQQKGNIWSYLIIHIGF